MSSGAVYSAYKKKAGIRGTCVLVFPDDAFKYVEVFEEYLALSRHRLGFK